MAIIESTFENEAELHDWVALNLETFLPGAKYLKGIYIKTISGKRGLPDGFAVNFQIGKWYILESELLSHGVWPHIAEQLTRFVVAIQNPESRRLIRNYIFETILEEKMEKEVCEALNTIPNRLHQCLEVFVEGTDPEVIVFIDETNKDLHDMAHALSSQIKIFRVKKYLVNGKTEYHSPDQHVPTLETEPSREAGVDISEYDVIEQLGGGDLYRSEGRFKVYKLESETLIHIKRSKYHEKDNCYWYAITTKAWEYIQEFGVTDIGFVMGEEGFVVIPFDIVEEFIKNTSTSKNEDGTIRHYHLFISPGPKPELFCYQDAPKYDLVEYYLVV